MKIRSFTLIGLIFAGVLQFGCGLFETGILSQGDTATVIAKTAQIRTSYAVVAADLLEVKRGDRLDIDVVIVWNVKRWARDEIDQWTAFGVLQRHGVEVASASEPIDSTPTGMLVFGIMGAIAAHERRQLSIEVSRGRQQKAEVGGTSNRAPLGYLNVREKVDGRGIRTIALDPERASLVKLGFELYASGNYNLIDVAQILEERGLRSRGTRRYPSRALSASRLSTIFRNPYYTGMVRNAGKLYKGRHPRLVSDG